MFIRYIFQNYPGVLRWKYFKIKHMNVINTFYEVQQFHKRDIKTLAISKWSPKLGSNRCCKHTKITEESKTQVYYGYLAPHIKGVKVLSLTTSIIGIASQPILYKALTTMDNIPFLVIMSSMVGFFTLVTPILLHFITKKYITHIDYNASKDTYSASFLSFLCVRKEIEFKTEDVKVPDIPGMFTTFEAKGKPMFVDSKLFVDPSHYIRIMGYDKPMDFKLYQTSENNKIE